MAALRARRAVRIRVGACRAVSARRGPGAHRPRRGSGRVAPSAAGSCAPAPPRPTRREDLVPHRIRLSACESGPSTARSVSDQPPKVPRLEARHLRLDPPTDDESMGDALTKPEDLLRQAGEALDNGDWAAARQLFSQSLRRGETPDALEGGHRLRSSSMRRSWRSTPVSVRTPAI
jgi:hypothetical protein